MILNFKIQDGVRVKSWHTSSVQNFSFIGLTHLLCHLGITKFNMEIAMVSDTIVILYTYEYAVISSKIVKRAAL